jgi:hypothetical protein
MLQVVLCPSHGASCSWRILARTGENLRLKRGLGNRPSYHEARGYLDFKRKARPSHFTKWPREWLLVGRHGTFLFKRVDRAKFVG